MITQEKDRLIIKRALLDLELDNSVEKAFLIKEEMKVQLQEKVFPGLVPLAYQMMSGQPAMSVRIPRIEIDLGTLTEEQIRRNFAEMVLQECAHQFNFASLFPIEKEAAKINGNAPATLIPTADKLWEGLQYFLQHGFLPSWCHPLSWEDFEEELRTQLQNQLPERVFRKLKEMLTSSPFAVHRFLYQFSIGFLVEIRNKIWPFVKMEGPAKMTELNDSRGHLILQIQSFFAKPGEPGVEAFRKAHTSLDHFWHVLERGIFSPLEQSPDWGKGVIKALQQQESTRWTEQLVVIIKKRPEHLSAMIASFSNELVNFLYQAIIQAYEVAAVKIIHSGKPVKKDFQELLTEIINTQGLILKKPEPNENIEKIIRNDRGATAHQLRQEIRTLYKHSPQQFADFLEQNADSDSILQSLFQLLIVEKDKVWEAESGQKAIKAHILELLATSPSPDANTILEKEAVSAPEEGIFIHNAGLALVLPNIQPLFNHLGYLNSEGGFKDNDHRVRAVHLIQYLATGNDHPAERDLSLNKVVCGIPLEIPIPRFLALEEKEKEEADNFLNAMLEHWKRLQGTSINGLRHNFLMREGKLSQKGTHWHLHVRKEVYDPHLMSHLPWGISVISFKWLTSWIQVEWL